MSKSRIAGPLLLWSFLMGISVLTWTQFGVSSLTSALTLVSALVALLPMLKVGPLSKEAPGRPSTAQQIDQAVETLAVEVRKQWDEESRRRRLQESRQMPVRWEIEERPIRPDRLPPTGELSGLVGEFATRPRPLVVIGEPGSGKTGFCVILTLELLQEATRARVPVLLQVSSWDPRENLDDWLTRRLIEDYPFLGNDSRFGTTVTSEIVAQRRVLPVLDGLDEMPAELVPTALNAIVADWLSDRPFVLTCRTEEFLAANAPSILNGLLVVRLLPLQAQAAANYLLDAAPDIQLEQWYPVLSAMVEQPGGVLAQTLTTPLMLFLARTAYESPGAGSPTELADQTRFGTQAELTALLLDKFVPAVFQTRPPRNTPNPTRPARSWNPLQAQQTLTFLARELQSQGQRNLAWWQLQRAVPPLVFLTMRTTLGALACGLLGWIMFGLFGRPVLGIAFGLAVGVTVALPLGSVREKKPRRFVPRVLRRSDLAPEFLIRDIGFGVVGALVGGLITGLIFGPVYGAAIGLVFALAFSMVRRFTEPTESREPVSPLGSLRSDRSTVLYALAFGGMVGTAVGGFLGGTGDAAERGLILELSRLQEAVLGSGIGLLLGAGGLGLMVHATSAWGRFVMTRIWLRLRAHTPLSLMTFLQDAHKLGVLRQVGATYQFRHALLQEQLATAAPPVSARRSSPEPAQPETSR